MRLGGSKLRFPLITICLSGLFIYFLLSFHGAEEEATKFSNQGRM